MTRPRTIAILGSMLKILAGTYRSRQLRSPPDGDTTRPYLARVRESVFNLLRGWWTDARVLDLFAGVGTVGLEAVSRGAAQVVMVERDRKIFRLLEQNVETLGCRDRVRLVHGDALSPAVLRQAPAPVDLAFLDPPYPIMLDEEGRARVLEQVGRLPEILAEQSFVVLRTPQRPEGPAWSLDGLDGPEVHAYGPSMHVLLYAPAREKTGANPPAETT